MHPFSFLACTYNLWGTRRWEERHRPLERFLELNRPDAVYPGAVAGSFSSDYRHTPVDSASRGSVPGVVGGRQRVLELRSLRSCGVRG